MRQPLSILSGYIPCWVVNLRSPSISETCKKGVLFSHLMMQIAGTDCPEIIIPSITLIFGLVANYGDIENDLRIFLNAAFLFFLSFYFMFSLNKIFKKGIN